MRAVLRCAGPRAGVGRRAGRAAGGGRGGGGGPAAVRADARLACCALHDLRTAAFGGAARVSFSPMCAHCTGACSSWRPSAASKRASGARWRWLWRRSAAAAPPALLRTRCAPQRRCRRSTWGPHGQRAPPRRTPGQWPPLPLASPAAPQRAPAGAGCRWRRSTVQPHIGRGPTAAAASAGCRARPGVLSARAATVGAQRYTSRLRTR